MRHRLRALLGSRSGLRRLSGMRMEAHSVASAGTRYVHPSDHLPVIEGFATPDATKSFVERFPIEHRELPRCRLSVGRIGFGGDDLGELADKRRRKLHTFVAKRGCNLIEIDIDGQHMRRDPH